MAGTYQRQCFGPASIGGNVPFRFQNVSACLLASITAVGDALAPNSFVVQTINSLQVSASGPLTLTSAPSIPDGFDGQFIVLTNVGANAVTISDQGTLASSNLRLAAATVAIGARQSVLLMFSAVVNDWVQVGPLVAVI